MKTIHINTESGWRGGEIQSLALMKGLQKRGHDTALIAKGFSEIKKKAEESGIQCFSSSMRGELDIISAIKIGSVLSKFKPDIIHAHTAHALAIALIAKKIYRFKIPVIGSRRVSFPFRGRFSLWKYKSANGLIAVSNDIKKYLKAQGIAEDKVYVVHSGIDLSRFNNIPDKNELRKRFTIDASIWIVSVGAIEEHKGHENLVRTTASLRGKNIPCGLIIAGKGRERGYLEELSNSLGLINNVLFTGFTDDVISVLGAADIFVLPSLSGEGSPAVLKEAMASSIPIVASESGGISEIVRHEEEAILYDPANKNGLFDSIIRIINHPEESHEMTIKAKKRVESFSMDHMIDETINVYRKILNAV